MTHEEYHNKAVAVSRSAKNSKQLQKAIDMWMKIAEEYPPSAYELFRWLSTNPENIEYACDYLQMAAEAGYDRARIKLAECLGREKYFQRNEQLAIELAEEYADDFPFAANLIGTIYIEGVQVEHDVRKAVQYFAKASAMGMGDASFNIGLICTGRCGGRADMKKAVDWFVTAAGQGYGPAYQILMAYYFEKNNLPMAYDWAVKGAKLGNEKCIEGAKLIAEIMEEESGASCGGNVRQSKTNNSEFSYTGERKIREEYLAEERRQEALREKNRDALTAAAAHAGGGFVDERHGAVYTNDGRMIYVDPETHMVYSDEGSMFFDDELKMLYSDKGTDMFFDDMTSMYDSRGNYTYIDK